MRSIALGVLGVLLVVGTRAVRAGDGPLGIDHEVSFDQSGIWARKYQVGLEVGVIAFEVGGALWRGNDDKLGHSLWQSIDSTVVASLAAEALKRTFSRARPGQGDDPNKWFQGRCCESFPSGEVTLQASFVTPLIMNYRTQMPWIWTLELLPLYDGVARLKSQAHWQTDVLAGWALGSAIGYWSAKRNTPISVTLLPRGLSVGFSKSF